MLKPITAIMTAAALAAVFTILTAPAAPVDAGPLAKAAADEIAACTQREWPYMHCVGTPLGAPHIRLVAIDSLFSGR